MKRIALAGLILVCACVPRADAQDGSTLADMLATPAVPLPTEPTALIAVVDGSPILYRDVSSTVDQTLEAMISKTGQEPPKAELEYARRQLVRRELRKEIQGKMMYRAFIRKTTSGQPQEKRTEIEQSIASNVRKMFYEQQLPILLKQYNLETVAEADAELRKTGSSLEQQERRFVESVMGQEYVRGQIEKDPEIPLPDMKFYYQENQEKFSRKARARWEQLSAMFSESGSKEKAYAKVVEMGNEAYFGGNMQAVAKRSSQEPLADETGGLHDWTRKGSLASDELDKQIFELPVGKMSQIIEDANGFHIIKVLERTPAGIVSFADAQEEIRKILQGESKQDQQKEMLVELEKSIPVWSMFPQDIPSAKPLERIASGAADIKR